VDELYRWETQVESGGTKAGKLKFITKETYEDCKKTRVENKKNVHDIHIKKWALNHYRRVGYTTFRATDLGYENSRSCSKSVPEK